MLKKVLFALSLCFVFNSTVLAQAEYRRASEDPDNVKNKLYPKRKRIDIGADFGSFINMGFINTYLVHGSINYFRNEIWGFSLDVAMGINSDKPERACLETFYNKHPNSNAVGECAEEDNEPSAFQSDSKSNYGPAYMPIREMNYMIGGSLIWNPVYGKQLLLLSNTSYFDFFVSVGGGVLMSTYYPKSETLRNGTTARCAANEDGTFPCGASKSSTNLIGEEGRPDSESATTPYISLGVGQKFHFARRFSVKFELRDMILLGTPSGFENIIALWGGVGVRL